ncbi:MAG: T9SS type A sorting domain-containing protein [Bacteroidales bacterium]|nr:T9SS type A sorting domain-containing protein [Bacteroidales bacterium]
MPCESEAAYQSALGWSDFTNYTDCISNSLNDVTTAIFNVYPNPASDKLFVEGEGYEQIKIYDLLGKVVFTAEGVKEIDVSALAKGVYNVQLLSNKGNVFGSKKIVKR